MESDLFGDSSGAVGGIMKKKLFVLCQKTLVLYICVCLTVSCLTGCAEETDTALWVLTELTTSDSFNYQIEMAAESFSKEHPEIPVQVDILPTDEHRYVLPLRYTMPILLSDPSNYAQTGISEELLNGGIGDLTQYALSTDDTMMAIGLRMPDDTFTAFKAV